MKTMKTIGLAITMSFTTISVLGQTPISGRAQLSGDIAPSTGAGVEIGYSAANGGTVVSYDRSGAAYKPLTLAGSQLGLHTNGAEKVRILSSGYVGIGTLSPSGKLHVAGTYDVEHFVEATDDGYASLRLKSNGKSWQWSKRPNQYSDELHLYYNNGTTWFQHFTITTDGKFGIGTSSPDAKLAVKGTIHTQEVKVDMLGSMVPDYVFEKGYSLPSLESIKTYIDQNRHLPEVPSAKEMEANGVNLGEMNMLLLKKIEELTLHIINQQNQIDELREKVNK